MTAYDSQIDTYKELPSSMIFKERYVFIWFSLFYL